VEHVARSSWGRAVGLLVVVLFALTCVSTFAVSEEPLFPSAPADGPQVASDATCDHVLLGDSKVDMPLGAGPLGGGTIELVAASAAEPLHFLVTGQQVGWPITPPIYITPATRLRWSWQKSQGTVCLVQLQLTHPETGQRRFLGYGAGAWSEPVSPDRRSSSSWRPSCLGSGLQLNATCLTICTHCSVGQRTDHRILCLTLGRCVGAVPAGDPDRCECAGFAGSDAKTRAHVGRASWERLVPATSFEGP